MVLTTGLVVPCNTQNKEVPQKPSGWGKGVAPDFWVGLSEHDGQQSCSACSQAMPHDDKPVFLGDKSRMSRSQKTKQLMTEERKGKKN